MRILQSNQEEFELSRIDHEYARELEGISRILEQAPEIKRIYARIAKELSLAGPTRRGRDGLTVEQVVKIALIRSRFGYTYRELEFVLQDSATIRKFAGLEYQKPIKKSALNENIRRISEESWRELNECVKKYAKEQGIEDGQRVRGDTTTAETNIHYPTDASLLWDCIRVLVRILTFALQNTGLAFQFSNHRRRAKKQLYKINNTRRKKGKQKIRHECYLVLIRLARFTLNYAKSALEAIAHYQTRDWDESLAIAYIKGQLEHYIPLTEQVIDQAYRRVVKNENVPAREKIVSIFEPHTDIIEKGSRDTVFGHKVVLTSGKSSMILGLKVLEGNPADSTLVENSIDEHIDSYGRPPLQIVFDGGFSSKKNAAIAKRPGKEIQDILFSKHTGLDLDDMVSSLNAVKPLMRFRAGIEAIISNMKRGFGMKRILEKGFQAFKAVLQSAVVAYNLTLLARRQLQRAST